MNSGSAQIAQPAGIVIGDDLVDAQRRRIGRVEELMVDVISGRVLFAVVSFAGVLGLCDRLFAIPWLAIEVQGPNNVLVLDGVTNLIDRMPGFDRHHWPDFSDPTFLAAVHGPFMATDC